MRRTTALLLKKRLARKQIVAVSAILLAILAVISAVFLATSSAGNTLGQEGGTAAYAGGPMGSGTITLAAVGDVCFGIDVAPVLATRGFAYPWAAEKQALSQADLTICNLESCLSTRGEPNPSQTSFLQRGDPAAVGAMRDAGVDLVVLANDHIMDYGEEGLADTIAALDRAGIAHCGAGFTSAQAQVPAVEDISGSKIAFLAFTDVVLPGYQAEEGKPGVAAAGDAAQVENAVRNARAVSDYVVVYFHWGETSETTPRPAQVDLAHAAIDAGAGAVIGSHPHVLQGLEQYHGGLIAYSMGNFVFNPPREEGRQSAILQVRLGRGRLEAAELFPVYITLCQPFPARGAKAEDILSHMAQLSGSLGTSLELGNESATVGF